MSRVIGLFSGKGGTGKTTVAVNLGALLASQYGKEVALVDCNLTTSHVGLHLGMYNYHVSLNHVLRDEYNIEEAIYNHSSGMKVVPASVSLLDVRNVDIGNLRKVVKKLGKMHDFVLLDAAPCLGREPLSALKASDEILYVTDPYLPSVVDIIRSQSVVQETEANPLGIVLNMVHNDSHSMKQHEIEYLTDLPVIGSVPYDQSRPMRRASSWMIHMSSRASLGGSIALRTRCTRRSLLVTVPSDSHHEAEEGNTTSAISAVRVISRSCTTMKSRFSSR